MAAKLRAAGANLNSLADASVVLINTCTVTREADAKSRKAVRRALGAAHGAVVIVCGCGATVNPTQFEGISGKHLIIDDKSRALQKAGELLGLELAEEGSTLLRVGDGFNTRAQIKVQDGCDNSCSYCVVPRARGGAQSMPRSRILAEIKALTEAGTQEIVLTGIDLGSYLDGRYTLVQLLAEALELGSTCRFRFSSIELPGVTDELIRLISSSEGRICAHLHVPLQSGSDAVLAGMNRNYDATTYLQKMAAAKNVLPRLAVTTDIIVGFPGETEEDFSATLSLAKELGFSRIHVFRFSGRPGTLAEKLSNQLPAQIKKERADKLRHLAEELMQADALCRIGTTESVLIESPNRGRSESYYPVRVKENLQRGSLVALKLVGYEHGELIAEKR